jgi:hypothetical protein
MSPGFGSTARGKLSGMHPHTSDVPGMPTEPLPIAQVNTGMLVVDADGDEVGTVSAVQMPGTGMGAAAPDLPPAVADRLARAGYLRVEGGGLLSRTRFVEADQVAGVAETDGGVVTLNVPGDALTSA